jgi:hypothetical protein
VHKSLFFYHAKTYICGWGSPYFGNSLCQRLLILGNGKYALYTTEERKFARIGCQHVLQKFPVFNFQSWFLGCKIASLLFCVVVNCHSIWCFFPFRVGIWTFVMVRASVAAGGPSVAPPTHDGVQKVSRSERASARGESSFGNARMLIHKSEKSSNKLTPRMRERRWHLIYTQMNQHEQQQRKHKHREACALIKQFFPLFARADRCANKSRAAWMCVLSQQWRHGSRIYVYTVARSVKSGSELFGWWLQGRTWNKILKQSTCIAIKASSAARFIPLFNIK